MPAFEQDGAQGGPRPAGHVPLDRGVEPNRDHDAHKTADGPERETDDPSALLDLQHTAGNAAVSSMLAPSPGALARSVVQSPGKPLDSTTSSFVRSATGADASG